MTTTAPIARLSIHKEEGRVWALTQTRTHGDITTETTVKCRTWAEAMARAQCRIAIAQAAERSQRSGSR